MIPEFNDQVISKIVLRFYEKATTDFLIGYQFRKIQEFKSADPLSPPIEAFKSHLPRIEKFWRILLLGESLGESQPFDLINLHRELNIRRGELDRWILLFKEVISEEISSECNREKWFKKIDEFERRFAKMLFT